MNKHIGNNPFVPMKIRTLRLRNNLIAAPMAGLSSLPYRILAMEQGCALAISEMVSAEGTIRAKEKTKRYFHNDESVRPFGLQLFGARPDSIARSIDMLEEMPIDLFDINMGCPVRKVCKKGAGSALMKTPALAAEIVAAARRATKKPVTVKIRAGWDDDSINCVEIAKIAEANGADAIAVHGRTTKQMFKGTANWRHIADVKSSVSIPVIGNGDVKTRDDAIRMMNETGCDGVMIGRAAIGNPWIFKQILDENYEEPTMRERGEAAIRHLEMLARLTDERTSLLCMRNILPWYGRGIYGIKRLLREINSAKEIELLKDMITTFFNSDSIGFNR